MTTRVLLLLLGLGVPWVAGADVLVMRDGSQVETKGEWTVKGATVVFTMESGTLGSLRLRDVDLDASAAATAEANAPKPDATETPPPRRQAVLTLTDDDVAKASDEVLAAEAAGDAPAPVVVIEGQAQRPAETIHVTVESWEESYDPAEGGVRVTGVLRNNGEGPASAIVVMVEVFGDGGEKLADSPARLGNSALPPGSTVGFSAVFPGLDIVRDVKFRVRHNTMVFEAPPPAASPAATTE